MILTGTGQSPHISAHGVTFQAGNGDTLEFEPLYNGNPTVSSSVVSSDGSPMCVICVSYIEYEGVTVNYYNKSKNKNYSFVLRLTDIEVE